MTSPPRVRRAPAIGGLALCLALSVAACTVETKEEAASTTTAPTTAPAATTTIPEELRPPDLQDVSVALTQTANYAPIEELTLIGIRPGSESIFVAERGGRIYEIKRDARRNLQSGFTSYTIRPGTAPYLDIAGQVNTEGDDQGLHGFAFSTDGSRLYVSFTNFDGQTVTSEFRVSGGRVSPTSQRELIPPIDNPTAVQNGGPIAVGSDGFLHIPLGDAGGDPFDIAQDPDQVHGKVLRIDPETGGENAYNIPVGNPNRGSPVERARAVYLLGLRDPSSIWFDPVTRDLWLTDTGADGMQEVNYVPWDGTPPRTGNFGWPFMNGSDEFEGEEPDDYLAPVFTYGPDQGCEVVGGVAYHGRNIPGLADAYVFGDRCTGRFIGVTIKDGEVDDYRILPITVSENSLSAIGADPQGEIWVVTNSIVYQLEYLPPPIDPNAPVPGP